MAELKTQKNDASVDKFLAGVTDEQKRTDCLTVLELMKQLNKQGITFIFATHHEFVLTQASRIIELKDGEVITDKQRAAA